MRPTLFPALLLLIISLGSCVTTKKFDAYVSAQYNDQIPQIAAKKKTNNIKVSSASTSSSEQVSSTTNHTKVLPLLFYWNIDHKFVCELNNQIGIANFSKTVNTASAKNLDKFLNGKQLELTVEQSPADFSMVDKTNVIWLLLYAVHWSKVYVEPVKKDLVISYKLVESDNTFKTGKISVHNKLQNQGLRLFQSWKSATSEYLIAYDQEITDMTKEFVKRLEEELIQTTNSAKQ